MTLIFISLIPHNFMTYALRLSNPSSALQNVICNYYIFLVVFKTPKHKKLDIYTQIKQIKRQITPNFRITWHTTI